MRVAALGRQFLCIQGLLRVVSARPRRLRAAVGLRRRRRLRHTKSERPLPSITTFRYRPANACYLVRTGHSLRNRPPAAMGRERAFGLFESGPSTSGRSPSPARVCKCQLPEPGVVATVPASDRFECGPVSRPKNRRRQLWVASGNSRISDAAVQLRSSPSRRSISANDRCCRTLIFTTSSANGRFQGGPVSRPENRRRILWVGCDRSSRSAADIRSASTSVGGRRGSLTSWSVRRRAGRRLRQQCLDTGRWRRSHLRA